MIYAPLLENLPAIQHGFGSKQESTPEKILGALTTRAIPILMHQTHSTDIALIETAPQTPPIADGLISRTANLALIVQTADCAPVLLADPQNNVVGAFHAGWRGALANIMKSGIAAMERAGAKRNTILAAIGPTISQKNYEVGKELEQSFLQTFPASRAFFQQQAKPHFDLAGFVRWQMEQEGVTQIWQAPRCTFAEETKFFSYRRRTKQNPTQSEKNPEKNKRRQFSFIAICP